MTNEEKFIEDYKKLEFVTRKMFHLSESESISYELKKHRGYDKYKDEIAYCQQIRNCLHHNYKINGNFPAIPSNAMIEFIESLIDKISNRKKCKDIAISLKETFTQTIDGNVRETMRIMQEKMYTNVPILRDGIVIGVFDENSLFCYLARDEIVEIESTTKFSDIEPFLALEERELESFLFVNPNLYVDELEDMIRVSFENNKRISMVFITVDGKADTPLIGILTPWDIMANNN